MKTLNEVIHQTVRLRIMAALCAIDAKEKFYFSELKTLLKVTDGNLGMHLQKLEAHGYIEIHKKFMNRRPVSLINCTGKGRSAYEEYVTVLKQIIDQDPDSRQIP
jgi:DNA-binding MarR family transcriptional regulator